MNWGHPDWLMALWALPIVGLLVFAALRSRRRALQALGPLIAASVGLNSQSRARRRLAGLGAMVVLVTVALAQPQWGFRWTELKQEGTSIVVVLDTSLSMDAEDVSPSRMERAHREILDLADLMKGDRVGLVLFSGGAYVRMPLSLDYQAFRTMVRRSTTATLKSQGSDLGAAIALAVETLGSEDGADRAIIIVSDGEDQIGSGTAAAAAAAEAGVHIFAVGVGTIDGAPIPMEEGGFKKTSSGDVVLSKLDENTLKTIAAAGNGAYVRSVAGSGDIAAIYHGEILGKLKRAEQSVRREKIWIERFQWPLGVAWFFGLLAFAARGRMRPVGVALIVLVVASPARAEGTIAALTAEQVSNPDDLAVAERLGGALFRAGRFNEASDVLTGVADRTKDSEIRSRARYNSGLAAYRGGRLTEALEAWQRVLQDQPDHPGAQKNAAAVQAEIQKRLGEEPPPQDGEPEESDTNESEPNENEESESQDQNDGTREPSEPPPAPTDTGSAPDPAAEDSPQPDGGDDTGEAPAAPAEFSEMTQDQAERMFESVQEGDPRVVIDPASRGGKDW